MLDSRELDEGDPPLSLKWEHWIIEKCGLDSEEYGWGNQALTSRILEDHLYEIIHEIEYLKTTVDDAPIIGHDIFGVPIYGERIYSMDQADLAYQILALLILETGAFLPVKVKEEVLNSTKWKNDKVWGWHPDSISARRLFLRQFRRGMREYIPGKPYEFEQHFERLEEINGMELFESYINSNLKYIRLIKFISLKRLTLNYCYLHTIPKYVFYCKNLEFLSFVFNYLTEIPKFILSLNNLKKLDLSHNLLVEVPDWIQDLKNLSFLSVRRNKIIKELTGIRPDLIIEYK